MNTQLSHRQQDAFLWFSNYQHELRLYQGGTAQNGYSTTTIDRVASLSVTGQGSGQDAGQGTGSTTSTAGTAQDGLLLLSAAGNTQLQAAHISNQAAGGNTVIQTGGDLSLDTVQTHSAQNINYGGGSHLNFASSAEVGTQIQTQGDLALQAGGSITARAAQVDAKGDLKATAGGSIAIAAGSASQSVDDRYYRKDSGFLSSSSRTLEDQVQHTTAQASSFGGNTVTLAAGQNMAVTGSQIISDSGTTLTAQNNITIEAATNTTTAHSFRESKSSGVFSSGGADITIGKQQQSLNQQGSSTSAAASTVGSIAGNTTIVAGEQYTQTGSDVIAPKPVPIAAAAAA